MKYKFKVFEDNIGNQVYFFQDRKSEAFLFRISFYPSAEEINFSTETNKVEQNRKLLRITTMSNLYSLFSICDKMSTNPNFRLILGKEKV